MKSFTAMTETEKVTLLFNSKKQKIENTCICDALEYT